MDQLVRLSLRSCSALANQLRIHSFEAISVLLFLVAVSEYDQTLREDHTVNRLEEAMTVFSSVAASRWFSKTTIVLLLNKSDLLREKLARGRSSLKVSDLQLRPLSSCRRGSDSLGARSSSGQAGADLVPTPRLPFQHTMDQMEATRMPPASSAPSSGASARAPSPST